MSGGGGDDVRDAAGDDRAGDDGRDHAGDDVRDDRPGDDGRDGVRDGAAGGAGDDVRPGGNDRDPLPEAARQRVLGYAAGALGSLDPADVPPPLRRFASFTPAKRARLAGPALATVLETDAAFRRATAQLARAAQPELADAVDAGAAPAAADPAEVGALAYLLRPEGWAGVVAAVAERLADRAAEARAGEEAAEADRLRAEAAAARQAARAEADRLRAEVAALKAELDQARRAARTAADASRRAEAAAAAAASELAAVKEAAARDAAAADTAARRTRTRIAELETQLEAARRAGREGRSEDNIRLRVLLDAVVNAAAGLRRELALPPTTDRPADLVAQEAEAGSATPGARGRGPSDPKYLDALLAVPTAHLVVDGYNVTKTGYPALSLEEQRSRLVASLRALAARTGSEITCVFDGAAVTTAAPVGSRQVRVHFTPPGRTADEAIAAFVAAEPPGRTMVVVSSDNEVAAAARRANATAVPSATLLSLLGR